MGCSASSATKSINTSPRVTTEGQLATRSLELVGVGSPPPDRGCRTDVAGNGARRLTDHQFAVEYDPHRARSFLRLQELHQHLRCAPAKLIGWLRNRRQMWSECVGPWKWKVVETHERDVVWHGQTTTSNRV